MELAKSDLPQQFSGLVAPPFHVDEDDEGATLWSEAVEPTNPAAEVVAGALGYFALLAPPDPGWFAQDRLRDRVAIAARQNPGRH